MAKPLALLYFTRDKKDLALEMAASVRNEGNLCNLVFATSFKGPDDALKCEAVIIQESAGRADLIADTYRDLLPGTEVHFYDDKGTFVPPSDDKKDPEPNETVADTSSETAPATAEKTDPAEEPKQDSGSKEKNKGKSAKASGDNDKEPEKGTESGGASAVTE
jgi:hypothetical protein